MMVSNLVIAYPDLSSADFKRIQDCRKNNDGLYYGIVDPHFTFVFGISEIESNQFIDEIKQKSAGIKPVEFVLRCAMVSKDSFSDYYHVFLVPDEGYSGIVKLHDKLYSGLLKSYHRLDIDFVPHINIANSKDKLPCKKLADEWNNKEFSVSGCIRELSIIEFDKKKVKVIEKIAMQKL